MDTASPSARGAIFAKPEFIELIWRTKDSIVFTIRTKARDCTSRNRESALKTLTMTEDEVRKWVEHDDGLDERRTVVFEKLKYQEVISWGHPVMPVHRQFPMANPDR